MLVQILRACKQFVAGNFAIDIEDFFVVVVVVGSSTVELSTEQSVSSYKCCGIELRHTAL